MFWNNSCLWHLRTNHYRFFDSWELVFWFCTSGTEMCGTVLLLLCLPLLVLWYTHKMYECYDMQYFCDINVSVWFILCNQWHHVGPSCPPRRSKKIVVFYTYLVQSIEITYAPYFQNVLPKFKDLDVPNFKRLDRENCWRFGQQKCVVFSHRSSLKFIFDQKFLCVQ